MDSTPQEESKPLKTKVETCSTKTPPRLNRKALETIPSPTTVKHPSYVPLVPQNSPILHRETTSRKETSPRVR
jgi:hypothetical protein